MYGINSLYLHHGSTHHVSIFIITVYNNNISIDIITFLEFLNGRVIVPLMLDTTDPIVLREALKRTPGKSIINSINLEDGEDRLRIIIPLIKEFGAAVVVGCIDDNRIQGQAITK